MDAVSKKTDKHKWTFASRFRAGTYSWKASNLAIQRIKEAVSEIKLVNRQNRPLAAEGAVLFIEKLVPSIAEIDSSSGTLGTAVRNALGELVGVIAEAEADRKTREVWLQRLWQAVQDDGYSYIESLAVYWGELCVEKETAAHWADEFIDTVKHSLQFGGYFAGSPACFSCLLAAGRNEELLELLKRAPYIWWHYRRFGVQALLQLGDKAAALSYAKESCGLNDSGSDMEEVCQDILISSGLWEEAYREYGLPQLITRPGLATFRKVAKKYPGKEKQEILRDAIENTISEQGKWFATAKQLGLLELAAELARHSPVEPKTLNRAAIDFLETNPEFALVVSLASLNWLSQGWGYDITAVDVHAAYSTAMEAARKLGRTMEAEETIIRIIEKNKSQQHFATATLDRLVRRG